MAIDKKKVRAASEKLLPMFSASVQAEVAEKDAKKANLLIELRKELEKKDYDADGRKGISLSFRFSDRRVDQTFPSTASRCSG